MAEAPTDDDPSIEDILDSIREIISDGDDDDDTGADDRPQSNPAPAPPAKGTPKPETPEKASQPVPEDTDDDEDDDILDLTDMVEPDDDIEDEIEIDMRDPNANEDEDDAVEPDEDDDDPLDNFVVDPEEPDSFDDAFENHDTAFKNDAALQQAILSRSAERATMEAFEDLARTALVERAGQVTLEDVVRQEVRPLLKNWLDDHLPGIVERLLEKELQRISNRYLDN